jgi:hypothetical protein
MLGTKKLFRPNLLHYMTVWQMTQVDGIVEKLKVRVDESYRLVDLKG